LICGQILPKMRFKFFTGSTLPCFLVNPISLFLLC
jgi:hypothetical protein